MRYEIPILSIKMHQLCTIYAAISLLYKHRLNSLNTRYLTPCQLKPEAIIFFPTIQLIIYICTNI